MGHSSDIADKGFFYKISIKVFNFEHCLAPAPSPSMVYSQSVQKVKKQPFGRLVLCLATESYRLLYALRATSL